MGSTSSLPDKASGKKERREKKEKKKKDDVCKQAYRNCLRVSWEKTSYTAAKK